MSFALNINDEGRILSATFPEFATKDAVIVEALPDGDIADYLYVDGEYVYEPLPKPEAPAQNMTVWDELDAAYREGVDSV